MALKILSVDDEVDLELLLTQFFRRKIRKGEYEFFFAHNGLEALELLNAHPDINLVLSDINMPEMDGLTLLNHIREMRKPSLKVIMVSAYGDMDNIRQAMNSGAFDFATKPIDLDDLQRTIEKAVAEIGFVQNAEKEHGQLVDIQSDLNVAHRIQLAILPQSFQLPIPLADQIDLFATMQAAKDVGGDFYDFFPIDEERIGFTMADVSGKGVPAAIFMAVSRTMIKSSGLRGLSSSETLVIVNDMLCKESVDSMFVTTFYGIYNLRTGEIDYTNAGHNPPYILRANGTIELLPAVGNLVLGALEGMPFKGCQTQLLPGDTLITFTDGVTEAENNEHNQYGEGRLETYLPQLLGRSSQEMVDGIVQQVRAFANGAVQSDDITVLVLKRKH